MLFNSFQFLLFFVIVTILYYVVNSHWRWLLLLLASCIFYMSFIPAYILVLFSIIIVDYTAALYMEKMARHRKFFLLLSITVNITVLAVFKYYNFFVENVNVLMGLGNARTLVPYWQVILPVGLSFHTFQAMSYTIEVYRGHQKVEKHFGIYALYVMFYPQLVAGPIERPAQLLPQLHKKQSIDYDGIMLGLKIMLWGFFMKVVLADRLAIFVDYVFARAEWHSRSALLLAAFFYPFQVYGDFAGYSLIAIGAAKTMGIVLNENFRQPYLSSSLTSFWTRWHITLYSWFRDYLYIPLGGNRKGKPRQVFNILLVFLLSGLWHGAQWNFIAFGLLQGFIIVLEMPFVKKKRVPAVAGIFYCFIVFSLCLIIFRSVTLHAGIGYFKRLFSSQTPWFISGEFEERALLVYSFFGIACVLAADIIKEFFGKSDLLLYHRKNWVRLSACIALVVIILLMGVFDSAQFIYFQF